MNLEEQFAAMVNEWEACARSRPDRTNEWTTALEQMRAEEYALRSRGEWVRGRDDFFGIVQIGRNEIRHSAMIAWLLDPCARHKLGSRVLERLLSLIGADAATELGTATVECEVTKGQCRADIVVKTGKMTLVVENKVDAPEAPKQCDELFQEFHGPEVRFLLLTPEGRRPESATEQAASQFKSISYRQLRAIIEQVLATSHTQGTARRIADDYVRTLAQEFP